MIRVLSMTRAAAAVALLALLVAPAAAQNIGKTPGSIRGVVKDDTGGVLPGVTVTATSPSLVGVRTVVTGGDGGYDFPGLAIGAYKVQATLSGFAASVIQGLDLQAGQTLRADLVMKAGLSETVTVEGSSIIDVVSVEQQNNISAETFNALPKGRSWESIVEIAPSVNTEDINRAACPSREHPFTRTCTSSMAWTPPKPPPPLRDRMWCSSSSTTSR